MASFQSFGFRHLNNHIRKIMNLIMKMWQACFIRLCHLCLLRFFFVKFFFLCLSSHIFWIKHLRQDVYSYPQALDISHLVSKNTHTTSLHHVSYNSYSPHFKNALNHYMPPHHGESVRLQLCCQNTDTKMNASLRHWQTDAQASFSLSFCLILGDRHALTTSSGPFKDMSNKSARLWDAVSHLRLLPNPLSDIRALMKCVNLLFFFFSPHGHFESATS